MRAEKTSKCFVKVESVVIFLWKEANKIELSQNRCQQLKKVSRLGKTLPSNECFDRTQFRWYLNKLEKNFDAVLHAKQKKNQKMVTLMYCQKSTWGNPEDSTFRAKALNWRSKSVLNFHLWNIGETLFFVETVLKKVFEAQQDYMFVCKTQQWVTFFGRK